MSLSTGGVGRSFLVSVLLLAGYARAEETVTAETAVQLALERNPELASLEAEVQAAEARYRGASRLLQANPEVGGAVGAASAQPSGQLEAEAEVSQQLEVFGQRSARMDVARASHAGAEARLRARRVELAVEVRQAFARALAADQLKGVAQENLDLARQTSKAAEKRLEVGDGSRIELNTARVEVGRAVRDLKLAGQSRAAAVGELKILLALEPTEELRLEGGLKGRDSHAVPEVDVLIQRAMRERAGLVAARKAVEEANAEQDFAGRDWLPHPRVGARYERNEGANVVLGTLAFDLPVFNQNQAGRGVAHAGVTQAERALEATERRIRQEVLLAASRLKAAQEAAQAFEGDVVLAMQENLSLVTVAYQAGKIDVFELLLIRRATLEAKRGYIEALEDVRAAEAELARAIGAPGGRL